MGLLELFWVFSGDVTAAMLVLLNNGTAAALVYPTNPSGIELNYHEPFLLFWCKNKVTDHVSETHYTNDAACKLLVNSLTTHGAEKQKRSIQDPVNPDTVYMAIVIRSLSVMGSK